LHKTKKDVLGNIQMARKTKNFARNKIDIPSRHWHTLFDKLTGCNKLELGNKQKN